MKVSLDCVLTMGKTTMVPMSGTPMAISYRLFAIKMVEAMGIKTR